MNAYEATLAAADHIERNPGLYDFWKPRVANDCGTPACMLGWIGYFMGMRGQYNAFVCEAIGAGLDTSCFYQVVGLNNSHQPSVPPALRAYAEKYLKPAQQPPDWNAMAARLGSIPMLEAVS